MMCLRCRPMQTLFVEFDYTVIYMDTLYNSSSIIRMQLCSLGCARGRAFKVHGSESATLLISVIITITTLLVRSTVCLVIILIDNQRYSSHLTPGFSDRQSTFIYYEFVSERGKCRR